MSVTEKKTRESTQEASIKKERKHQSINKAHNLSCVFPFSLFALIEILCNNHAHKKVDLANPQHNNNTHIQT